MLRVRLVLGPGERPVVPLPLGARRRRALRRFARPVGRPEAELHAEVRPHLVRGLGGGPLRPAAGSGLSPRAAFPARGLALAHRRRGLPPRRLCPQPRHLRLSRPQLLLRLLGPAVSRLELLRDRRHFLLRGVPHVVRLLHLPLLLNHLGVEVRFLLLQGLGSLLRGAELSVDVLQLVLTCALHCLRVSNLPAEVFQLILGCAQLFSGLLALLSLVLDSLRELLILSLLFIEALVQVLLSLLDLCLHPRHRCIKLCNFFILITYGSP
mmetsp:Transcript_38143/g.90596  ORF Transcript_38143/g.90596 Transcript_38143/m.90596 type:complete len:267 (+) Transcript_38143:247-1047(+)